MAKEYFKVESITKKFGGLIAVNDVSFDVKQHEILSIIGPNGAGKSTLFKLISSFLIPTNGQVIFEGKKISNLAPHQAAKLGVIRTFQETTIFRNMSVLENVIIAHHLQANANLLDFYINSKKAQLDNKKFYESAMAILKLVGLDKVADEFALNLPHGFLRALGIAIGMSAAPKILLLDEPFAGMNMEETASAVEMVRAIRKQGITVLLVEHDMHAVMKISDRIVVLNFGEKIAEGSAKAIQNNKRVIEAYLGVKDDTIGI
ncbi:MAG: ABC transporter ATP-binding protein [Alphaproteobacteria bacterium]